MKLLKTNLLLIFLLSLSVSANSADISYENLKSLVEKRSLNLEADELEIKASSQQEGQLLRSFTPEIELHAAQETFKEGNKAELSQPTYGLEAKMNIFNGWRNSSTEKIRIAQTEIRRYKYKVAFADELKTAREIYWKSIYTKESIQLLNQMIELNEKSLKSARQRINAGVAAQSDRYEFEMKAIDLRQKLRELNLAAENLKRQMKLLFNYNSNENINISGQLTHDHDYELALKHSPADHDFIYKDLQLSSEIEKLKSDVSKSNFWPKLDLYASYKQNNQLEIDMPNASDRIERTAGIKLTLNLNEGFENYRQARASLIEAEAFLKRAQYHKREVELHVENEISELDLLHSQVHDSELSVEIAEKYFNTTLAEYSRGVKNSPDVLSAAEKLYEIKNKRLEIIRDFQLSKTHILSKIAQ